MLLADYEKAYLSSTPRLLGKSSNGWRRTSSTGIMRPRMVLMRLSSIRAVKTEQEYRPYCWSSPYWEPPSSHSSLFLAPCRNRKQNRPKKKVKSHSFVMRHILAQLLKWLMLITITIGMCLMNGYSDFKVQTHPSKDKQVKE